uniref:Uncharacterized protein n=1 Tax=Oryza brachyantha TaxID=4533 RepID=J3LPW2_ORYBR
MARSSYSCLLLPAMAQLLLLLLVLLAFVSGTIGGREIGQGKCTNNPRQTFCSPGYN